MSNTATVTAGDLQLTVTRDHVDHEGRTVYAYTIGDATTGEELHTGADLSTGVGIDHGPADMLGTLAAFLSAAVESYPDGENADLFPAAVIERADGDALDLIGLDEDDDENDRLSWTAVQA